MDIRKKIIFAFILIVVLLSTTGLFLIQSMQSLARETENIYRHPFAVSNASRDIKIHLITVQSLLKDILLAEDVVETSVAREKIMLQERLIYEKLDLIKERFLGDKAHVEKSYQAFTDWKKTCDEMIVLKKKGEKENALEVMKGKFAGQTDHMNQTIHYLSDFASAKANEFYTKTLNGKMKSLFTVTSLLALIIIGSVFILVYVIKHHDLTLKEINRNFHLIDQNIMLASTDSENKITDISNALCRFLGSTKKEMIGQPCDFFINSDDQKDLTDYIYRMIDTGCEWKGDIRRIDGNGKTRWINQAIHPVFDENFRLSSFTHIIHDVTDKKILEDLSITDKLTSLYNRRYFDEVIDREIRQARRNKSYLTLAIMDIDHFKKYNDQYGHPAGDEVLVKVSEILKKVLKRPDDFLFRVGGEEFGIIFSGTDPDESYSFLEKIRKDIESLRILHDENDVSSYITVSIGARVFKSFDIPDKNQFYVQTDQLLYQAKQKRNQVVVL